MRTLTDENGDPWFVGKDVATILGYTNPRKALIDHVDDEDKTDGVTIRDSIGREQNPTVINESGLYSLILSSKLPTAKRFKRWVVHEVLPTIRKTGGYIPASEADSDEDILAKAVLIAQKTIDLKNQQLRAKDAQIKELEPKAQALDAFTDVEDRLLVRDAAKILSNSGTPISEKQLREWMTANDWIYKHNGSWHATAKHCTAGHLVMVMSQSTAPRRTARNSPFPRPYESQERDWRYSTSG